MRGWTGPAPDPLVRCDVRICPDHQLIAIARDDDTTFGILHSRFHELWSLRLETSLEDRPRHTPSTTFETFPFPVGLTPDVPAADYTGDRTYERAIRKLLSEDARRKMEAAIVAAPDAAPVVRGTGGIRKLRWAGSGRGKRGGIRAIYFWCAGPEPSTC